MKPIAQRPPQRQLSWHRLWQKGLLMMLLLAPMGRLMAQKNAERTTDNTAKHIIMWVDATANFQTFSHPDSIDYYVRKLHLLGFTDLVVDVRPVSGEVLFDTSLAPKLQTWKQFTRPDFNYLGRFITIAHAFGMKVHAAMNCFSAGHNYFDRGPIYTKHAEWASMQYTPAGRLPITQQKEKYAAMVNPLAKGYLPHMKKLLKALLSAYPTVDGVVLDRVRYDGIEADFSDISRRAFEHYIHHRVEKFPQDIFTWVKNNAQQWVVRPGKWYALWIEWRAKVIHDVMVALRKQVKQVRPEALFGTYTGAWYPTYYEVGVNFAHPSYHPERDFAWATPRYHTTGYMPLIDFYMAGNYYPTIEQPKNATDEGAQWYSVEGSCRQLRRLLCGHPFYGSVLIDQLAPQPEKISRAIQTNLSLSDGVMLFDISHLIAHPQWWNEVEKGLQGYVQHPSKQ